MSINGTSHISVRDFTIRTGNDGHTQAGRIHTPDPAAVANLKRILAQKGQAKPRRPVPLQEARKAAILEKARERKRPSPIESRPEQSKELSVKTKKTNDKWSFRELITAEMVAGWAERIRAGESRNQVAKNNELGVSDYTIRRYLEMHGYHRTTGQPTGEKPAHPETAQVQAPKPARSKPAEPVRPKPTEAETAAAPAEKALAVAGSSNGYSSESAGTAVEVAAPAIDEQMANLRRLLAELPRGKGIKIHGKISIELEF